MYKILRFIKFGRVLKTIALTSIITFHHQYNYCDQQKYKIINEKDVQTYILNPQYYQNTIIVLNEEIIDKLPSNLQAKICVCQTFQGIEIMKEYDIIAINQHRCMLIKFREYEDYLRLSNFLKPMETLICKQQALDLINKQNARIIFTYVPQQSASKPTFSDPINELDQFKKKAEKDYNLLEQQFKELRYSDCNRDAQYYIIRDQQCAEEFKLSNNDIGEIYVLKETNQFNAKESTFIQDQKEYNLQKLEPDPNREEPDYFKEKEYRYTAQKHLADYFGIEVEDKLYPMQQLDLRKTLKRVQLMSSSYVNQILNRQQLDSFLLLSKQMGTRYLLVCLNNGDQDEKIIRKLINVKKSINIDQQHLIQIIYSENSDMVQQYFGMSADYTYDHNIRLIDLCTKQSDNLTFNIIQNGQINKHQQEHYKCQKRYLYDNTKITANKLKQFLQYCTNIQFTHLQQKQEIQQIEEYYDKNNIHFPFTNFDVMTANHLTLTGYDLIYFYKPRCKSCYTVSQTLEKIVYDLKNPKYYKIRNIENFKNISLKKYNIFNESIIFPSPRQAPMLVVLKDGQMYHADLLKHRIDPRDEQKMCSFLTKFIESI